MAPPGHILGFDLGYPFQTGAILSFTPHAVTAGSGWTGATSWPTSTGVGTGFTTPPTQSDTINGSGYNQRVIAESTHVYYDYAIDDSYYVTFHGGGDYARTGAITWQIYFESDTPQTFTQADYQYDPYRKVWGLPISFRPKAGFSGVARFYAKCIPANGQERMLTGEVWCNRSGTTGYYDRHANAIYVSGVDYNGSNGVGFAGIGTNDTTVGTAANPNYRIQRAVQFASGAREGCYIYIKGAVVDDTNGTSRPTTTVPCRIMPWPGAAKTQCKWGKTSRTTPGDGGGGGINMNINKYQVFSIIVDSDTIVRFTGNSLVNMGFHSCTFLSDLSVGLDQWGYKKGIIQTVGTINSQSWVTSSNGERRYMIDCDGDIYCPTGFHKVVNTHLGFAWDAFYFVTIAAGLKNIAIIGSTFYGPDFAYARFHYEEELTVATVGYTGNWATITFSGSPTLDNNAFETRVQILTGALAGNLYGAQGANPDNYATPAANEAVIVATNTGTVFNTFPAGSTLYVALTDLGALGLATGDKLRVYNLAHKDAGQWAGTTQSHPFIENVLFHGNAFVSNDAQWVLNQVGTFTGSGTVTITGGTTATFSASQTFQTGHFIRINSNNDYAMISAGGTGTVFTLDRTITNVAGATFGIANSLRDVLYENNVYHLTDTGAYKGQWQVGAINCNLFHNTIIGEGTGGSGQTIFRNAVNNAGFGLTDWTARNNLFIDMTADSGFPATGIILDHNHYILGTARGTNTTTGAPAFAATGSVTSSYYPTAAAVGICAAVYLPYDRLGNVRSVGSKVGASASG